MAWARCRRAGGITVSIRSGWHSRSRRRSILIITCDGTPPRLPFHEASREYGDGELLASSSSHVTGTSRLASDHGVRFAYPCDLTIVFVMQISPRAGWPASPTAVARRRRSRGLAGCYDRKELRRWGAGVARRDRGGRDARSCMRENPSNDQALKELG